MSITKLFIYKQDNIFHVNTLYFQKIKNLRNRTNVELVHTEERFIKLISKPSVESFQRFSEDLVAVKMLQPKSLLK